MSNSITHCFRYLVYCTDLEALSEAKDILEGEKFDIIIGIDDGKELLKVHREMYLLHNQ